MTHRSFHQSITTTFVLIAAFALFAVPALAEDPELLKVEGFVTAKPETGVLGQWTLGTQSVIVDEDTIIDEDLGPLEVGACAEAIGSPAAEGSILAVKLQSTISSECEENDDDLIKMIGPVTKLPSEGLTGIWTIRNRDILVSEDTEIDQYVGPVRRGACVEVEGLAGENGIFAAVEIRVRRSAGGCSINSKQNRDDDGDDGDDDDDDDQFKFYGLLQELPEEGTLGGWVVGGREVVVDEATIINQSEGMLKVGACLEVEGILLAEGGVLAKEIDVEGDRNCGKLGRPGRDELVSFFGKVDAIPESGLGVWTVAGRTVLVDTETDVDDDEGPVEVGACVEVKAKPTAGVLIALKIESEDEDECAEQNSGAFKFYGVIEELPVEGLVGDWLVAGREIRVFLSTEIDERRGAVVLGACVEVEGNLLLDGAVEATEVEVKSSSGACVIKHGVVSAASFADTPVSPGKIISIFGIGIGPETPTFPNAEALLNAGAFPKALGGVKVYFDGELAPLVFVSQGQLNAVVPYSVAGKETVEMQIEYKGIWSPVITLKVEEAAPGVFTMNQSGEGRGAILNHVNGNYVPNSATTPAKRNSIVLIYITGEGQMEPALEDGVIVSPEKLSKPKLPVRVYIGGVEAIVEYAGSAPNLIAGLLQINVKVAPETPTGSAVKVEVWVGGEKSQSDVTMAVAP